MKDWRYFQQKYHTTLEKIEEMKREWKTFRYHTVAEKLVSPCTASAIAGAAVYLLFQTPNEPFTPIERMADPATGEAAKLALTGALSIATATWAGYCGKKYSGRWSEHTRDYLRKDFEQMVGGFTGIGLALGCQATGFSLAYVLLDYVNR